MRSGFDAGIVHEAAVSVVCRQSDLWVPAKYHHEACYTDSGATAVGEYAHTQLALCGAEAPQNGNPKCVGSPLAGVGA